MNDTSTVPHRAPPRFTSRRDLASRRLRDLLSADALWLGLIALALALHAESILMPGGVPSTHPDIGAATRWYAFAVALLLIGWWGVSRDVSLLRFPLENASGIPIHRSRIRLSMFGAGLVLNVVSVLILGRDWYSATGGWLWACSLALLVLACVRERVGGLTQDDGDTDQTSQGSTLPAWAEIAGVVAILALAVAMRLWKLGVLWPGMHGDEGEAGSSALAILHGVSVSPFMRGWFNQYNVFFWSVALFMKLLGSNLVGLRMFAVVCGVVTTAFVYLIGREMFGTRAGLFAGAFMAFQSADLLFSRMVMTNTAAPATSVIAYYFLIRGLRTRHHLDFTLAGLASAFGVYYYAGGRLEAPIAVAVLVYLAILHRRFLRAYWSHCLALIVAALATALPFLVNLRAYPLRSVDYPNNRFVWLNYDALVQTYGTRSWPIILWDQLQRSLSLLTYSVDVSANNILTYPPVRPIEAVLIVLGLAWAAVRFRDTRFGLLNIWFWATIVAGGVLTVDQPNLPRICAALPVLPLLMAAVLDRFAGQIGTLVEQLSDAVAWRNTGQWIGSTLAGTAVAVAGIQNWHMYIGDYLNTHQNPNVTAQAMFVQQHGLRYRYYDMGHPLLYFNHGDNRFINQGADGTDVVNPADSLPILDNGPTGQKDSIVMIWQPMYAYLSVVQAYYPEARLQVVPVGDPDQGAAPIEALVISHSVIDRHRTLLATYRGTGGAIVRRRESDLGTPTTLPSGLRFPVRASWSGGLVAPENDTYRFQVAAPPGATLQIDGQTVATVPSDHSRATGAVALAQGVHDLRLAGTLPERAARIHVRWSDTSMSSAPVRSIYLWDNHVGRAWSGSTQPIPGTGIPAPVTPGMATTIGSPEQRIDGFIGFRSTGQAFGIATGIRGKWDSVLTVRRAGMYRFELNSLETATLSTDGRTVVDDPAVGAAPETMVGTMFLRAGRHRLHLGYTWQSGVGYLELLWQPPGSSSMQMMLTPDLQPARTGAHVLNRGHR